MFSFEDFNLFSMKIKLLFLVVLLPFSVVAQDFDLFFKNYKTGNSFKSDIEKVILTENRLDLIIEFNNVFKNLDKFKEERDRSFEELKLEAPSNPDDSFSCKQYQKSDKIYESQLKKIKWLKIEVNTSEMAYTTCKNSMSKYKNCTSKYNTYANKVNQYNSAIEVAELHRKKAVEFANKCQAIVDNYNYDFKRYKSKFESKQKFYKEKEDSNFSVFKNVHKKVNAFLRTQPIRQKKIVKNGNYIIVTYQYDKQNGPFWAYSKNKTLLEKGNMLDNKLEGKNIVYYETGEKKIERTFINGVLNGLHREYYKNSKLKSEFTFVDGKKDGVSKLFYESGKLQMKGNMVKGELKGLLVSYDEEGNVLESKEY